MRFVSFLILSVTLVASEEHWSFQTIQKPEVPKVEGVENPIDAFLQKRLKAEGLKPANQASKEVLVRRLYLDLTGLPPTIGEVNDFVSKDGPEAVEELVKDLMKRPTFGEHMARYWLDLARYADTHGLHLDNERSMWPYRDWVVQAFNQNLPFDEFTRWQIAGDLIPNASIEQKVASGFNRCNVTTGEGGSIAEEWIFRNAVDRTTTVMEVWTGLTAGCAVCHDHKFDPISQKEYYSLYSFFHSAADPALDGNKLDTPPVMQIPQPEDKKMLAELEASVKTVTQNLKDAVANFQYTDPAELEFPPEPTLHETVWIDDAVPPKAAPQGNTPWKFVEEPEPVYSGKKSHVREATGLSQHFFTGANPPLVVGKRSTFFTYVFLDTINPPKEIMLQFNNGSWDHRAYWGENKIEWGTDKTISRWHMGKLPETGSWVRLEVPADKVGLKEGDQLNGWAFTQFDGKVYWDKSGIFSKVDPATDPDFSWAAWKKLEPKERDKELNKEVGGKPSDQWKEDQEKKAFEAWLVSAFKGGGDQLSKLRDEKKRLIAERDAVKNKIPVTFVMADLPKARESFVMNRGQYNQPGEKVSRDVPAFLPQLPEKPKDRDYNRLDLADWLLDKKHPLTARVAVNRFWQQFFGVGLVKTSGDFGTQGEAPSHPELLDWLAAQFVEDGWDMQKLITRILTSHAYLQDSKVSAALLERDPENRLLARGPRYRLDAEVLRDQALYHSGLMVSKMGGRGVMPYQPPNIWEPVGFASSNTRNYKQGTGEDLYRRSIYTFFKRTAPPPFMSSFDAPNRELSCPSRGRSNTPLQALQLMNDIQHVEAARNFAQRILKEGGKEEKEKIEWAWKTVTSRQPKSDEVEVVHTLLKQQQADYQIDKVAAKKLIEYGESKADPELDHVQLAAWTLVANLLLNLDEVVNKN